MLFNASTVYAPGEPHGDVPARSGYQDTTILGRFHLDQVGSINLWIGIGGLLLIAYLVHRHGGRL